MCIHTYIYVHTYMCIAYHHLCMCTLTYVCEYTQTWAADTAMTYMYPPPPMTYMYPPPGQLTEQLAAEYARRAQLMRQLDQDFPG